MDIDLFDTCPVNPVRYIAFRWTFPSTATESEAKDFSSSIAPTLLQPRTKSYVYSLEKGSLTHRLHLQGFAQLLTKARPRTWAKALNDTALRGIEAQACHDRAALETYCCKTDATHVSGPYRFPAVAATYDGADLPTPETFLPWQRDVYRYITRDEVHPREIVWLYDPDGNIGKTDFFKFLGFKRIANCITASDEAHLTRALQNNPVRRAFIFDLPRNVATGAKEARDLFRVIEHVKDGKVMGHMYDSKMELFARPHVVILSNSPPAAFKAILSADRINCKTITGAANHPPPPSTAPFDWSASGDS